MRDLFGRFRRAAVPEPPLRDELLSIERLEERAKSLAARFTVAPLRQRVNRVFPRLRDNTRVLRATYAVLADDVHRGQLVTAAAEWLLDHFHLVTAEIRAIRQNLPHAYYRELPRLPQRQWAGHTRIYAMALELIRHSDSRLDRSQLVRFINSYQSVAPLTIGELWAWPSILKLALIENLRRLAEEMMAARTAAARGGCGRQRMGGGALSRRRLPRRPIWRTWFGCFSGRANTASACRPCTARSKRTWRQWT